MGRDRRAHAAVAALTLLGGAVFGLMTLVPAAAQEARALGAYAAKIFSCHSSSACTGGLNTGSGFGVVATSIGGNGVDSATKNPSKGTQYGRAGVYGHDDSTDGGILNVGVAGYSNLGSGIAGTSSAGVGVSGQSTQTYGVSGTSANSYGVSAFSQNGTASIAVNATGDASAVLKLTGGTSNTIGYNVLGFNQTNSIFDFDNAGNESIAGLLYTAGPCKTGCSRTHRVISYEARETVPSIEDVGEGQIVDGKGRVALDAAYANVIDGNVVYSVFITPEGPNRGLYVTQKGPSGFTVMENPGGHATIAFSYRVVAKPYGVAAARLPMTTLAQPAPNTLR